MSQICCDMAETPVIGGSTVAVAGRDLGKGGIQDPPEADRNSPTY